MVSVVDGVASGTAAEERKEGVLTAWQRGMAERDGVNVTSYPDKLEAWLACEKTYENQEQ